MKKLTPTKITRSVLESIKACADDPRIHSAARDFEDLQARKTHPEGEFDKARRFTLDTRCPCCVGIRTPSARYPFSEMIHGRSAVHVSTAAGIPNLVGEVRRAAGAMRKQPALRALDHVRELAADHLAHLAISLAGSKGSKVPVPAARSHATNAKPVGIETTYTVTEMT